MTFAGNWNDEGTWSPKDGSKIAFACRNEGDFNICVMDVATGSTVQLTSEGSNGHPGWSPDGEKIVYQSADAGLDPDLHHGRRRREQAVLTERGPTTCSRCGLP